MSTSSPARLYLCIDCGGTKTAAVIASQSGAILSHTLAGPSNFTYIGIEAFLHEISAAVVAALRIALSLPSSAIPLPTSLPLSIANPSLYTFSAAWLGISGVDSPSAITRLTPEVSTLLGVPAGPALTITNDVFLLGAPLTLLKDVHSAVACIGGTGSIIVSFKRGRTRKGRDTELQEGPLSELARVGGWGWILGDEGGGFDVGRTAICTLLKLRDAASAGYVLPAAVPGKQTLQDRIFERFGINNILDVLEAIHMPDPVVAAEEGDIPSKKVDLHDYAACSREKRLSALSPLVFAAAFEDDDPIALRVLEECASKLASQIALVLNDGVENQVHSVPLLLSRIRCTDDLGAG